MQYYSEFPSVLGNIILFSDGEFLTGLYFENQKNFAPSLIGLCEKAELSIFNETKIWLSAYFSGKKPDFTPKYKLSGTDFQIDVWNILEKIPYGSTKTYGEMANELANAYGIEKMSAQAVGNALGRNPIALIIPCHRVVGTGGKLTGYAGGIERKQFLLEMEINSEA